MRGYYNDPQATAAAFEGGWFHTGDAAVVHPDGYVEIRDRFKDVIISGGENISSIEVEGVLLRHPRRARSRGRRHAPREVGRVAPRVRRAACRMRSSKPFMGSYDRAEVAMMRTGCHSRAACSRTSRCRASRISASRSSNRGAAEDTFGDRKNPKIRVLRGGGDGAGSVASTAARSGCRSADAVRGRRYRLDERHAARERADIRYEFFTPEIRFDMNYLQSGNHPIDHTIVGSTEEFRSGEFQIEQVSFGGDFHWENVKARFLSMFGMFATTTPRNDASSAVGQWDLQDAYRYFSEANAGYHFDVNHGLNVDVGIFVSYIGLFSYYNYDNWTYQPSFVSSNTPWFFNGLRVQWYPTQTLKIEPWLINGWQSYAKFNSKPGFGGQILWIPNDSLKLVFNSYSIGQDNLNCQNGGSGTLGTTDTLCQPQNGGNPNAAVGSYVGAGRPWTGRGSRAFTRTTASR
jgi:hypothetical protein